MIKKYIGKYRLILIETPENNKDYTKARKDLERYKKELDSLGTIVKKKKSDKFMIYLIGIDGNIKYKTKNYNNWDIFLRKIREMPMEINKEKIIKKLSLYADYHPDESKKGFGYKDKKTAEETIRILKRYNKRYQFLVIITMYNRAKYHYNQTKDMREAMKVYEKWLNNYKKNES